MEEQYVSFEAAKIAKEKGWKEWCSKQYRHGKLVISSWPPIRYKSNGTVVKSDPNQCYAPTQSLLQKWIRETYASDIIIEPSKDNNPTYTSKVFQRKYLTTMGSRVFATYEEALEDALITALNFIR